jgi:hypothetical protein
MGEGNQIFGRIYKIVSTNTTDIYIGSTTDTLHNRFLFHMSKSRRYEAGFTKAVTKSHDIIKCGEAQIALLYEGLFDSRKDLYRMEGQYIQANENAINRFVVGRTRKEHYQDNRERILLENKQYREINIARVKEHANEHFSCETCGGKYSRKHKSTHEKSKKHVSAIENKLSKLSI